jgi:hypothetical protein
MARNTNSASKNIYSVRCIFTVSFIVDVFEMDSKDFLMRTQCMNNRLCAVNVENQ